MTSVWIRTKDLEETNDVGYPHCRPLVLHFRPFLDKERFTEFVRADSIPPDGSVAVAHTEGLVLIHGQPMTIAQIESLLPREVLL